MIRSAILSAVGVCMVVSCAEVKKTHQLTPMPNGIPMLHIVNDTTATALKISVLDIKTVVAGNIATTRFDMRFYNPNDKILEGEFEFPLSDGQHITRYALDMNGSLREAVVVEKAKARVAFEATVRRGIDPGLVEKTKGNNFKTRIYPLPAKGYRRIVIEAEETLEQKANKDLVYQLPLYEKEPIDSFSINMTVIKSSSEPEIREDGSPILDFKKQKENYVAEYHQTKFIADQTIAFVLKSFGEDDMVFTQNHDAQTYFYVNSRIEPKYKDKNKPATIGLFWDVSSSGENRDRQKEIALLKKYLSGLDNVSVSLIPFNIYTQPKEDFTINGGNSDKLITRLDALTYDGGTQFGALDLTKYNFDEALLFSDGLSTFGRQEMVISKFPVFAITTSPSANYSYLKYIAQQTHGKFIDLSKLEPEELTKELDAQSLQIINIIYDPAEVEDLVMQTTPIMNTGLSFAGKLKTASADIKVELGFGNEVIITKKFTISKKEEDDYDQVNRIWATMKIAQLDMEYEKNKEEITKLGKAFIVVTQNTSLLVLDRVEDYVEHEIVPPAELQNEYYGLLKEKQETKKNEKETAFTEALEAMQRLQEWWKTDYSITKKPVSTVQFTAPVISYYNDSVAVAAPTAKVPEMEITAGLAFRRADTSRRLEYDHSQVSTSGLFSAPPPEGNRLSASNATTMDIQLFESMADKGISNMFERNERAPAKSGIELNEWKPEATYLKALEQTSSKDRFKKYLSLKKEFSSQPSFFVDVARLFIEKNEKELGIQILSNVAEMKLEDAELSRIVANQLLDAGEKILAIETFEQILKMREEDPQSYRDLALAYSETGDYNKAVEFLYKLVTGTWDERFGDVKAIAINEMNAIISAHGGSVTATAIDKRLIFAMPVDVRIVIGWSADNSDIDLWITDPNKEKCFYEHTETEIGGRISQDVTQGFGPEEFLLKKALNGDYIVDVNLYGDHRQTLGGPISIKADLFTDFGKPNQKRKTINFRVTTDKEVINLGSLKFGS